MPKPHEEFYKDVREPKIPPRELGGKYKRDRVLNGDEIGRAHRARAFECIQRARATRERCTGQSKDAGTSWCECPACEAAGEYVADAACEIQDAIFYMRSERADGLIVDLIEGEGGWRL